MGNTFRDFYTRHAVRYAQVVHDFIQSDYSKASHLGLTHDLDLVERLKQIIPPGSRG